MLVAQRDKYIPQVPRRQFLFKVGDRVITNNSRLGTVVRLDRDEQGEFVVVSLDLLPKQFAYDPWDLEKV